jgi:hypothetical protein
LICNGFRNFSKWVRLAKFDFFYAVVLMGGAKPGYWAGAAQVSKRRRGAFEQHTNRHSLREIELRPGRKRGRPHREGEEKMFDARAGRPPSEALEERDALLFQFVIAEQSCWKFT